MNRWLSFIDLKGGIWLGLFSAVMLVGVVRVSFFNGIDIPEGVLWVYGTVITAYTGTKISAKAMNGKNGQHVEEQ